MELPSLVYLSYGTILVEQIDKTLLRKVITFISAILPPGAKIERLLQNSFLETAQMIKFSLRYFHFSWFTSKKLYFRADKI